MANRIDLMELEEFTQKEKRRIIKALKVIWDKNKDLFTLEKVNDMLRSNSVDPIIVSEIENNYDIWDDTFYVSAITLIYASGGNDVMKELTKITGEPLTLDLIRNQKIREFIDSTASDLSRLLGLNSTDKIQNTISDAIMNNWDGKLTQSMMKDGVALTEQWQKAVNNAYKTTYERTLSDLLKDEVPIDKARAIANKTALRAKNRKAKFLTQKRTERIYRTEIAKIKGASNREAFNQAIRVGVIKSAKKKWVRTNFTDNWESSIANNGVVKDINEPFDTPNQNGNAMYPNEINELCNLLYTVQT